MTSLNLHPVGFFVAILGLLAAIVGVTLMALGITTQIDGFGGVELTAVGAFTAAISGALSFLEP